MFQVYEAWWRKRMQVNLTFKSHYWQGRKKYPMPYKNNSGLGEMYTEMNKIHLG